MILVRVGHQNRPYISDAVIKSPNNFRVPNAALNKQFGNAVGHVITVAFRARRQYFYQHFRHPFPQAFYH